MKAALLRRIRQSAVGIKKGRKLNATRTKLPLLDRHLLEERSWVAKQEPNQTQRPYAGKGLVEGDSRVLKECCSSMQRHDHSQEESFQQQAIPSGNLRQLW